jgi:hypothetical protein
MGCGWEDGPTGEDETNSGSQGKTRKNGIEEVRRPEFGSEVERGKFVGEQDAVQVKIVPEEYLEITLGCLCRSRKIENGFGTVWVHGCSDCR